MKTIIDSTSFLLFLTSFYLLIVVAESCYCTWSCSVTDTR